MEVRIVRLSRPLLIRVDKDMDDYHYQTIYGFQLPEGVDHTDPLDKLRIEQYMGYLAGLHCCSSGDDSFSIQDGRWVDENGEVHTEHDTWVAKMEIKYLLKLGLSYDVVTVDADEEDLHSIFNEERLVVNEDFYYDTEKDLIYDTPCEKESCSEDGDPLF